VSRLGGSATGDATALVRTNAATSPAWADNETLLLDPATPASFEARLPDVKAAAHDDSDSNPPPSKKKKKRKRNTASDADESEADYDTIVCEHCGGAVPQVSLRVASLDGTTLVMTVAQRGLAREVKRLVGYGEVDVPKDLPTADSAIFLCAVARDGPGRPARFGDWTGWGWGRGRWYSCCSERSGAGRRAEAG
jgi:hypothetical protein